MPAASLDEGRTQIAALVERFLANEDYFVSPDFDETSTREQFINGFFEALGWDVLDVAGLGPDREVIFHPRLRDEAELAGEESWDEDLSEDELAEREPLVRIPDYAFRYDSSTRFFVEAKRAGITVDARSPAFQVKSYAWSHQVRIGVLTNFRQLRVFETMTRPDYGAPRGGLMARISIDCQAYADQWQDIWALLSHEAVAGGSIERTARYRRGTLQVGESFLNELTEWREVFARDLAERNLNPRLDRWELAEATQRILDRLIFLRVCEDRTLEQDVVLRRYARRTDAYHHLQPEMRRLDDTYNGALFAPHFSERLEVSDAVIQRFIEGLYFPHSPYRFDVIGVDLLGDVYERFLGTEITLDGRGRVRFEEKPEVRHAGGVYYTPNWIVRTIVERTIGPLLEGRTPRTAEQLKIVDPACGSGSFLLGAVDYFIEWHEAYYAANPTVDPDRHIAREDGTRRLTADAKAAIVTNSLYGVDIDPQAVEVAQMSLYLKILESETGSSLHEQTRLFHGAYLPSLAKNILSGNSLLGPDEVPGQLMLDEELRHRINPFNWRDRVRGFGEIFEERGGFDAVIGNPPYTRVQVLRQSRRQEAELYDQHFASAQASYDIASLFVERGLSLLRGRRGGDRGGRLGFIVTRTFAETNAGQSLRELLSGQRHVAEIVDFGAGTVFEDASAYTMLLFLTREPNPSYDLTRVPLPATPEMLAFASADTALHASRPARTLDGEPWDFLLPLEEDLLARLGRAHPALREVSGNSIFQGVVTGADLVFRCEDAGPDPDEPQLRRVVPLVLGAGAAPISVERACLRPVVAGSNDLHRFRVVAPHEWLILPYEPGGDRYQAIGASEFERRFPRAYEWLEQNRTQLEGRAQASSLGPWNDESWILYSRRQNLELFPEPKVMVPYMIKELTAMADEDGAFFVNVTSGGYGVGLDDEFGISREYLAALLNSELLSWALKRYSRAWRGDYFGARNRNLSRLAIYIAGEEEQAQVIGAFNACVSTATQLDRARSDRAQQTLDRAHAAAVRQFDDLIYELYGITDAERRVIRS